MTWARSLGLCLSPQAADPTGLGLAPHQEPQKLPDDAGGGRGRSTDRSAHSTAHGDPSRLSGPQPLTPVPGGARPTQTRGLCGGRFCSSDNGQITPHTAPGGRATGLAVSPHPGWPAHTSSPSSPADSPTRPSALAGRPQAPQCPAQAATAGPREQHVDWHRPLLSQAWTQRVSMEARAATV